MLDRLKNVSLALHLRATYWIVLGLTGSSATMRWTKVLMSWNINAVVLPAVDRSNTRSKLLK